MTALTYPSYASGGLASAAEMLRAHGRGDDSMLVHMTPNEVNSLQGLAMAAGGSLAINPHTGLPEAGFLGKILPTILGIGLNLIPGVGPLLAAGITAAGTTAITGDLSKGLMAGLGAFGGASLGGAVGLGGEAATAVAPSVLGETAATALPGAGAGALAPAASVTGATYAPISAMGGTGLSNLATTAQLAGQSAAAPGAAGLIGGATEPAVSAATGLTDVPSLIDVPTEMLGEQMVNSINIPPLPNVTVSPYNPGIKGFMQKFGDSAAEGIGKSNMFTTGAAGLGLLGTLNDLSTPKIKEPKEDKWDYEGPYVPSDREVSLPVDPRITRDSSEYLYFSPSNPVPGYRPYAEGGEVKGLEAISSGSGVGIPGHRSIERDYGFRPLGGTAPSAGGPTLGGKLGKIQNNTTDEKPDAFVSFWRALAERLEAAKQAKKNGDKEEGKSGVKAGPNLASFRDRPRTLFGLPEIMANGPTYAGQTMPGMGGSYDSRKHAYARGGKVPLKDGSFVVDARTVSELGNGSSGAGQDMLAKMGGKAIRGRGDGASDSIKASIDGKQPARVARDEVHFPPKAVRRVGGGSHKKGTKKLFALMAQAEKARKAASRGADNKLRTAF